jgi:hypothetical protein
MARVYYDIPMDELPGWFFMTSGNEVPLRVAQGYSNLNIDHRLVKCAIELSHHTRKLLPGSTDDYSA